MTNPVYTIGGKPFVGPNGQAFQKHVAAAPNGATFGVVKLWVPEVGTRYLTVDQDTPIDSGITALGLRVYGTFGGERVVVPWIVPTDVLETMQASTGELVLGDVETILRGRSAMTIEAVRFVPRDAAGDGACPAAAIVLGTSTILPAIGSVIVSGTALVGSELTATPMSVTGEPTPTYTYRWRLDGVDIEGATAETYTPTVLGEHTAVVIATNAAGSAETESDPVMVESLPTVSGAAISGSGFKDTLHSVSYTAGGFPQPTVSFQWKMDGVNVGADASTYTPVADGTLTCVVTVTNPHGSDDDTAAGRAITTQVVSVAPTISGLAITSAGTVGLKGDAQTASFSVSGQPAPTLAYQWKINGAAISGATSASYTPTQDSGTLTVTVTATNAGGSDTETSSGVTIVAPVTLAAAPILGEQKIALVSRSGNAPAKGDTFTATWSGGSATATVVAFIAGSSTSVGDVILGPITGGPVPSGASCSWTSGGAAAADGESVAYGIVGGQSFYWIDWTFAGTVTSTQILQYWALDDEGAGATQYDFTGVIPDYMGSRYYKRRVRVIGRGTGSGSVAYTEYETAWIPIGRPTLTRLSDREIIEIGAENTATGEDQLKWILFRKDRFATEHYWTTRDNAFIDANPFPSGFESMTYDSDVDVVVTTIAVDGMTGAQPAVGQTITSGSKTAIVVEFVVGTLATAGTIYARALAGGAIADNASITWTGGACLANGASSNATVVYEKWLAHPTAGSRDGSIFLNNTTDNARRTLLACVSRIGGELTPLSNRRTVPFVSDDPQTVNISRDSRLTNRSEEQQRRAEIGGGGMQFPRAFCFSSSGSYWWQSFDVSGPCESFDGGRNWQVDNADGLWVSQSTEGADIVDDKYVIAIFGGLFLKGQGNIATKCGVYRKNLLTREWDFVQLFPNVYGSNGDASRQNFKRITWARGTGTNADNRVCFALSAPSTTATATGNMQLYKSVNSGATWATDGAAFSAATHGNPLWMIADSTAIYIATSTRLIRRPFAGGSWTVATGLPSGSKNHVEKIGSTIYVGVEGQGLYTAPDAGTLAFTLKKSFPLLWFSVSPANPDRIVITRTAQDTNPHLIHTMNDGADGWPEAGTTPYPGQHNTFAHRIGGNATWVKFHPSDPDVCYAFRFQHNGRSDDGGANFIYASTNQDYSEVRSFGYHPSDPLKILCGMTDRIVTCTDHGAAFVMDDALTNDDKTAIRDAIGPSGDPQRPSAISARGVLMALRTNVSQSATGTGNGALTVSATDALPGGTYTFTCTAAAANGGTFAGVGPRGLAMGNWTVGAQRTFDHPDGGSITATIADGSTDHQVGKKFTVVVEHRTGYLAMLGENLKWKVPMVFGRAVTLTRTPTSTGNGDVTDTASLDLPAGEYVFRCTTAGGTGVGKLRGTGPLGIDLGEWTVGTERTFEHPRGGTLTMLFEDGTTNFVAGGNPFVATVRINPVGGTRTLIDVDDADDCLFSQTNPAVPYRGCTGKHVFSMDASGVFTHVRSLAQTFVGYAGTSGDAIHGVNGSTVYKSSNEGQSFSQLATGLGNITGIGRPVIIASHHDENRGYVGRNNGQVAKYQGSTVSVVFNLLQWCVENDVDTSEWTGSSQVTYNGVTRYMPIISGVAESWFDPNLLYCTTWLFGAPYNFFRTKNALAATPVWENITKDEFGRGLVQPIQGCLIHPLTDEPFKISAHGTVMSRPDEDHRTAYGIKASVIDHVRSLPGGDYYAAQPI